MQAGFPRLFACRERDEKEELPLEFSLRILLNPRMLSCSLNLLQCQFDGAASIAALLGCAAAMCGERWVGGGQAKFFFTRKRGASSTFRMKFAVPSPSRLELRKAPRGGGPWLSFFLFQEPCPNLFLSHALPAAGCDSKLSLGSGVQSSELSRQSLAYPGPTEINLAWSVRLQNHPHMALLGHLAPLHPPHSGSPRALIRLKFSLNFTRVTAWNYRATVHSGGGP